MRPVGLHLRHDVAEFGDDRPFVPAQIGELDAVGVRQIFLEHGFGAAQIARIDIAHVKRRDVETAIEFRRMSAKIQAS